MVKVSTQRRKQQQKPEPRDDGADFIEAQGALAAHMNSGTPPAPEPDTKDEDDKVDVKALLSRLDALQAHVERVEAANLALTAPAVAQNKIDAPKPLSLEGLPDPAVDPDGYTRELNKRLNETVDSRLTAAHQSQQAIAAEDRNRDLLWEDFAEEYPDLATDQDKVAFVTTKVLSRAQQRGLDVNRYMFQNSPRFFKDIEKEYTRVFGEPTVEDDGEYEPAPRRRQRAQPENDGEVSRTGGIFGGLESGNKPAPRANGAAGDMIKELQDIQRKTGFY